ncbi:MAG: nuclear transport factor 2 family protein [Eudoraea sp.]|nr:nuclear transport factor 2 family protein [Maribacter sp.]NNE01746.1 nuclear transport factor 2 family protein [Eudoraea sp.]
MRILASLLVICLLGSCNTKIEQIKDAAMIYEPEDLKLYETIVAMDKKYFDAYNTCDMATQDAIYAEDIEFFHDKGGLMTSKSDLMKALEENICNKVTRQLVQGSIEVYPIKDYGAVEIGFHSFQNKEEPNAPSQPSKFIVLWKQQDDDWKITKVISLH